MKQTAGWSAALAGIAMLAAGASRRPAMDAKPGEIQVFSVESNAVVTAQRAIRTDAEWKQRLTPEQYRVCRIGGTECAFTGALEKNKETGLYRCIACGLGLFRSSAKFESGTGWPSFFQSVHDLNIREFEDRSRGMVRTEIRCALCDSHLGHVFRDGPRPTGLRYCVNSAALEFQPEESPGGCQEP